MLIYQYGMSVQYYYLIIVAVQCVSQMFVCF